MSKDIHALPETKSWREIPQQVRPRAMSGEGRRRLVMRTLRAMFGFAALCGTVWGIWAVASSLRAGQEVSASSDGERVKSLVLVTDGVLDKNWLAKRLAIPQDATLMGLDLASLRARILADPQVVSATVVRNFPSTLTVRVSERSPVVRMMYTSGREEPTVLLVARDGVAFQGTGFDKAMLESLPWLEGAKLDRSADGLAPLPGMREVSELLACAKLEADNLYSAFQVVSVERLPTDNEIDVHTKDGLTVVFGAKEDYLRQIARLSLLVDSAKDPTHPLRMVNLSLGSQVPVAYGTAAPTFNGPPVNGAAAPAQSRAMISFPTLSNIHIETNREL